MTWIRTIPPQQADGDLKQIYETLYGMYPDEYHQPNEALRRPDGSLDSIVQKIRTFSDYLGNEISLAVSLHGDDKTAVPLVIAEIARPGLPQFLQEQPAFRHCRWLPCP